MIKAAGVNDDVLVSRLDQHHESVECSGPQVSDIAYMRDLFQDYGLAPLRAHSSHGNWFGLQVQPAVLPPLLPYAVNFRD